MPATASFIKVTSDKSIPVRIFVNRLKLLENSSVVSVNERSIVRLQRINILKLSNPDIRSLLEEIRQDLIDVLTEKSISELMRDNKLRNNRMIVDINGREWKCYISFSVDFLVRLRVGIGRMTSEDIEHMGKSKDSRFSVDLLQKSSSYTFKEDKKMTLYRIRRTRLMSGFHDCLDVYVYGRPSK